MTPGEITGCFPRYQKVDMSFYFLPGFKLSRFSSRPYSQVYHISTQFNDLPSACTSWRVSSTSITLRLCYEITFHSEVKGKHLRLICRKFRSLFFINFSIYNHLPSTLKNDTDLCAQPEKPSSGHIFKKG